MRRRGVTVILGALRLLRVGVWVMLFLLLFTVLAWRLNAAYWKDIR